MERSCVTPFTAMFLYIYIYAAASRGVSVCGEGVGELPWPNYLLLFNETIRCCSRGYFPLVCFGLCCTFTSKGLNCVFVTDNSVRWLHASLSFIRISNKKRRLFSCEAFAPAHPHWNRSGVKGQIYSTTAVTCSYEVWTCGSRVWSRLPLQKVTCAQSE